MSVLKARWRLSLSLSLSLSVAALATAAPAWAASDLLSVLHEAVAADPAFGSARFAQQMAAESEPQARAALLPSVAATMGGNATRYNFSSSNQFLSPNYDKTFTTWGPTLALTLPLYRAQLWDSLSQAKLAVTQSEATLAQARAGLALRVAQAYFDVLAAQDALAAIAANLQAVSEQLAQARREFEVGTKTIVDA